MKTEFWTNSSVNFTQSPVTDWTANPSLFLTVTILALALAYLLFARVRGIRVSLRILSAVFLAGWLGLDFLWQQRLFQQLKVTRDTFAHLPPERRSSVAEWGPWADFARAVRMRAEVGPTQRVFVASALDFPGMRLAYHLYPLNVYWHRYPPELPRARHFRSGDLIVIAMPSKLEVDPANRLLILPSGDELAVEPILMRPYERLYRVP